MNTPPPQKVNPSALAYRLEPTFQQHVEGPLNLLLFFFFFFFILCVCLRCRGVL